MDNSHTRPERLATVEEQLKRMTRRSFEVGIGGAAAGLLGWNWLRTREKEDGVPWPFRRMLQFNERVSGALFKDTRLAPTFAAALADEPRVNGHVGLGDGFRADQWQLRVKGTKGREKLLSLADIQALPKVEMITELKCIEGWSNVVKWTGARLFDLATRYGFGTRNGEPFDANRRENWVDYVRMATPDEDYYVGLDIASALHPQTLLCYAMNDESLTAGHGAPLRLAIPVKYGIKNIKRIGTLEFTDRRPADYWAERGYDWYAGH